MIDQQILFVCATPDDEPTFQKTSTLWKSVHNRPEINLKVFYSNTIGLSQLYNKALRDLAKMYDIVVFVHDDVSIEDAMILKKLKAAHQHYDIVGLAGGEYIMFDPAKPPLWHLMCKTRHGAVAHPTEKDGSLTMAAFGNTPAPCDLIDGLFISVNTKKLRDQNVNFDDDMTFHFYDLALCMRARAANLKIGVWPIWVVHQGLGDSYQSHSWEQCAKVFKNRYLIK